MKIVAVADLHGFLPDDLPEGDLLIVAGDVTPVNDHSYEAQVRFCQTNLAPWVYKQKERFKHGIVGVGGNHDFIFDPYTTKRPGVIGHPPYRDAGSHYAQWIPWEYLDGRMIEVEGVKIYGTPYVPILANWAFYADEARIAQMFSRVPAMDLVVSHGPPRGAGDVVVGGYAVGSESFAEWVKQHEPKAIVCGHIHEAYGMHTLRKTPVINASYVNENYLPGNPPIVFDL